MRRVGSRLLIAVLVTMVSISLLDNLQKRLGNTAVKAACERDGGLRVRHPVNAAGYIYAAPTNSYCDDCMNDIASRRFTYVVFLARRDGINPLAPLRGYYRMKLSTIDDLMCSAFDQAAFVKNDPTRFGLSPQECIASERLDGATADPVYTRRSYQQHKDWTGTLGVNEYRIDDPQTGNELGVLRDYLFISLMAPYFDMGAGIGAISSSCRDTTEQKFPSPTEFRQATLRPVG